MKVAAAQIACALGDVDANVRKMRDFSARAKNEGVELIVFPEASDTGYSMPVIRDQAKPWTEGAVPALQAMAKEFAITIVAGVSERDADAVYNSQVFIDPSGVVLASASADREELLTADISTEAIADVRNKIPVFAHRRSDLYR